VISDKALDFTSIKNAVASNPIMIVWN